MTLHATCSRVHHVQQQQGVRHVVRLNEWVIDSNNFTVVPQHGCSCDQTANSAKPCTEQHLLIVQKASKLVSSKQACMLKHPYCRQAATSKSAQGTVSRAYH